MADAPFLFSLVADEVSDDLDEALAFAVDHDMTAIELTSLWGTPFEAATDALRSQARAALRRSDIRSAMVLSPAFKTLVIADVDTQPIASIPGWSDHVRLLESAMVTAVALDCPYVRVFTCRLDTGGQNPSPRLPGGGTFPPQRLEIISSILRDAANRANDLGLTVCVENVRSCFGNTGRNTAAILSAVDHPAVRTIWDPANDFVAGGTEFREGYEAVKPWIVHVHAKDAVVRIATTGLTEWTAIGRGALDWPGQLRALVDDGYPGLVSLETHWHPDGCSKSKSSHESFEGLLAALRNRP